MYHHLLVVCAAIATVAAAIAVLPQAVARGTPARDVPRQSAPSQCTVTHTMTASPDVLLLGEQITVTLGAQASCPEFPGPLHIALVLDGSGSMAGQKNQQLRQAAPQLIRGLDMPSHPSIKVGAVEFNVQARRLCSLTNDENQAVGCARLVGAYSGSRIDLGISEGLGVIGEGRSGLNQDELAEVMIILSDGVNDAGCGPVLSAARRAKGQGILVVAVCLGNDCDQQCMRQVASSPRYYDSVPDPRDLAATFDAILQHLLEDRVRRLSITYEWGDRIAFIGDSAIPHQSEPTVPDDWLRWEQDHVAMPAPGITHTLRLLPLHAGTQLVGGQATGELIDQRGRTLSWQFDLPLITVLDRAAPPTATTTLVASPTATATSTPSPTATSMVHTLHLPRTLRNE